MNSISTTILLLTALAAAPAASSPPATTQASRIRIVLVGDSTVTDKSGWGMGFARHLDPEKVECVNLSRGGRSSKSFINEGHWNAALQQRADYILIQFGHNDCPGKGPQRETDPDTTYYQHMARYVDEARAAGAKPVLITSLTRRRVKDGRIASDLWAYANAVRKLAADKQALLIDLHQRSIDLCNSLGPDGIESLNAKKENGTVDRTHLDARGAELFGAIVAEELERVVPELAEMIR